MAAASTMIPMMRSSSSYSPLLEADKDDEHETVMTSPLSLQSLSPDNPLYHGEAPPSMDEDASFHEHHVRKPSTVSDLPPAGFYKSTSREFLVPLSASPEPLKKKKQPQQPQPTFSVTHVLLKLSKGFDKSANFNATWIGFWALLWVTCANYMLTPVRDAIALQVGLKHMPALTLASTALATISSVPIGWLFEAPDPKRRKLWKKMGLTRGETQGTSLALFYRCFAASLLSYAVGFELLQNSASLSVLPQQISQFVAVWFIQRMGLVVYVAFFLVVHLMKLHSLSLVWGVTTEAMDYEEHSRFVPTQLKSRLERLAFVGFGGTVGGIVGSLIASTGTIRLSGILVLASLLLELSAMLSIELGRIMQIHWQEERRYQSTDDLSKLCDSSLQRSRSMDSMKRVASGNSLSESIQRTKSMQRIASSSSISNNSSTLEEQIDDNSFSQRLMRGITTILRSRLLMAIFTYNALYASTSVLLSFQRAELVHNRSSSTSTLQDTAFLAKINILSSMAVFGLQATGTGAWIAKTVGNRGTLSLIPIFRLLGVMGLVAWHVSTSGKPPNLTIFLILDECTKVINFAVAKPVRESLWRGLSNEARYEAKPIVDTLANRWGGGSAAFLVGCANRIWISDGRVSPNMMLCLIVATWWAVVSADLGHVRRRIDLELCKTKKQQ